MAAQPIQSARRAVKPTLGQRRRDVPQTVELLCNRHGEAIAQKLAERERKRARQARSRKHFGFWTAVVAEIELRRANAPGGRHPEQTGFARCEMVMTEILEGQASE